MPSQPEKDVSRQRVYVIDDEPNLRASLLNFFESVQIEAVGFGSAEEFLSEADGESAGCILLDIQMPGMTGLELQAELSHRGNPMPIIFITGNGSVSVSVSAMKAGAFDFLLKPFNSQAVVDAITRAMEADRQARAKRAEADKLMQRFCRLTPRETEVWEYVSQGLMNKQIAFEMSISEIMVKLHRGRMMKKMHAKSVVDVVRMFDRLSVHGGESTSLHT
ncbi:response regulator transcription factor (plasmid) [Agrobacterium sp. 33MFTa1.1]|uniref:response regulator transcription factor n=1 Tax=unclassified Agrobacterium TaxID=2632611 RepID=UPI00068B3A0A|nr:response regulator [Agrobacterium sp. 33MFTa1.1]MBA8801180.1 FixJ family two-component response regulator [Agrobacterium sp. RC10-4-1]QBJ16796.1 response regulator transcription factor [Agrobacterium sp. 33MFTa1.1]